jgi:hypothetical protein
LGLKKGSFAAAADYKDLKDVYVTCLFKNTLPRFKPWLESL